MTEVLEVGYFYTEQKIPAPVDVMFRAVVNSNSSQPFIGQTVDEARAFETNAGYGDNIPTNTLWRVIIEKVEQTV